MKKIPHCQNSSKIISENTTLSEQCRNHAEKYHTVRTVPKNFTANAVSVAIGDNGNRLIFEIWWNFFYDLFSIKNVADVNSIDSFVSKRNIPEKIM